jgi:hypothetical protein
LNSSWDKDVPPSSFHLGFFDLLDLYGTLRNQRREQNRYQNGDGRGRGADGYGNLQHNPSLEQDADAADVTLMDEFLTFLHKLLPPFCPAYRISYITKKRIAHFI